jgi:hypothetical protein
LATVALLERRQPTPVRLIQKGEPFVISAFTRAEQPSQKILEGIRTAFLLFNLVGFVLYPVEITVLGHWLDSLGSKIPYLAVIPGFIFTVLILWNRRPDWIYYGFIVSMVLMAVTGVAGFVFHVVYNFEGEISWKFLDTVKALEGSRPSMAPLAFTHIGLTGLLCAYRAR